MSCRKSGCIAGYFAGDRFRQLHEKRACAVKATSAISLRNAAIAPLFRVFRLVNSELKKLKSSAVGISMGSTSAAAPHAQPPSPMPTSRRLSISGDLVASQMHLPPQQTKRCDRGAGKSVLHNRVGSDRGHSFKSALLTPFRESLHPIHSMTANCCWLFKIIRYLM